MRLSEAMRLGAMYGPQLKYVLTRSDGSNCALGAIVFAVYGVKGWHEVGGEGWGKILTLYPQLQSLIESPITKLWNSLSFVIVDLNNERGWTREAIADWIEATFETPQPKEGGDANEQQCDTSSAAAADRDQEAATVTC